MNETLEDKNVTEKIRALSSEIEAYTEALHDASEALYSAENEMARLLEDVMTENN